MLTRFVDFLYAVPMWEALFFLVLTLITVYRKRLSSNDIYRQQKKSHQKNQASQFASIDLEQSRIFLKKYNKLLQNMVFSPYRPEYRPISTNAGCNNKSLFKRLSTEMLVHVMGYLETHEIVLTSISSTDMRETFTSDLLWEQLWISTYGEHWQHDAIVELRKGRDIFWDPAENFGPPQTGWFHFYLTFEACWLDWILAGYCTDERCIVAIGGSIYDVTSFLLDHPGSPETLTEGAGCDASDAFEEIGHSIFAEGLKRRICIWDPQGQYKIKNKRAGGLYTQDEGLRLGNLRCPPPSRLRHQLKSVQKSIANLAMEALLPHQSAKVKRVAAQAAQRIALSRVIEESPPLFGPPRHPVRGMRGYYPCSPGDHVGHAKSYYDPLAGEWNVWWSCCGMAQPFLLDQFQPGTVSR